MSAALHPAVRLYRAEKRRAITRGCYVLTQTRRPVSDDPPKRDQKAYNAEYWARKGEILKAARATLKAIRLSRALQSTQPREDAPD